MSETIERMAQIASDTIGSVTHYPDLDQGSEDWFRVRCGLLTASEMKLIITPTMKVADNDKTRAHVYELLGQRISQYVEPTYIGDDMLRGQEDEILARAEYAKHYARVDGMGFITNNEWGFTLGYSPDGLVGDDGLIEAKSRQQKFQVQTIIECVAGQTIPDDYVMQVQTGLLVSKRKWCDFISYGGGWPMVTIRVFPDPKIQDAIVLAATAFEKKVAEKWGEYRAAMVSGARLIPTERRIIQEMYA